MKIQTAENQEVLDHMEDCLCAVANVRALLHAIDDCTSGLACIGVRECFTDMYKTHVGDMQNLVAMARGEIDTAEKTLDIAIRKGSVTHGQH